MTPDRRGGGAGKKRRSRSTSASLPTLRAVAPRAPLALGDGEAQLDADVPDLEARTAEQVERIAKLQRLFHADGRYALLVVLQGRDASGKDGTIRKVFTGVNPHGIEVSSFKVPTELELRHDFLWRIHQRVPAHGTIGIFNRSHYEDVLVARVNKLVGKEVWERRFGEINDFEEMLAANRVRMLKFFLHISRAEQRARLEERLADPKKNWKFRAGDLDDRRKWAAYTAAYRDAIRRCSTPWAPWYVVPADDKKLRTYLVARTIADTLDALDLRWPKASADALTMEID